MSLLTNITYDDADSLSFDATNVEVASGTLRLKDLGGGTYTTDPQLITSQYRVMLTELTSFAETDTLPADTAITYQLVIGDLVYWYNSVSALWEESDGTVSESNTASEINTNAGDLFTDLSLLVNQFLGLRIWLATTNASNRPELTDNDIGYEWEQGSGAVINEVLVSCYLGDLLGNVPITPEGDVVLTVGSDRGFMHGNRLILPFSKSVVFDSAGLAQISVIETATPGKKLSFFVTYYDGRSVGNIRFEPVIVPNLPNADLNSLTIVVPYDFG